MLSRSVIASPSTRATTMLLVFGTRGAERARHHDILDPLEDSALEPVAKARDALHLPGQILLRDARRLAEADDAGDVLRARPAGRIRGFRPV